MPGRNRLWRILTPATLQIVATCSLACFVATASAATPAPGAKPAAKPQQSIQFETHVRPILKAHCFHCHGEEEELQGGLDLRLVRLMTKGGESGTALVVGKHADSLLFQRIASDDMPPGDKKLSADERETIARWIDAGARTQKSEPATIADFTDEERAFWSFQPVRGATPPQVKNVAGVRTPVDAFLLAKLESQGLGFSSEADAATLIRRVTFDLIGLPPTPEEVSAFVAEYGKNPKAYETLVERLLASPHYGERWGRHWLDVAGYSDSDGYSAVDAERKFAYRYRDYVICSFNEDKPWNEFIVEQLAGDELVRPPFEKLPVKELDKLIATGYLRMGPDGTSDPANDQKLAQNDCVAETLKIVSTSLLGLSVGWRSAITIAMIRFRRSITFASAQSLNRRSTCKLARAESSPGFDDERRDEKGDRGRRRRDRQGQRGENGGTNEVDGRDVRARPHEDSGKAACRDSRSSVDG
ncbi:MAG: DUF1549 domain-containing protein [Pirellulales bacterium]